MTLLAAGNRAPYLLLWYAMGSVRVYRLVLWCTVFAVASHGCTSGTSLTNEAEIIRRVEQARLRALVDADFDVVERVHADDFELINPDGEVYSRDQYLGQIRDGILDYTAWEAGPITVRVYGEVAVIRYQDQGFEVRYDGKVVGSGQLRHTNFYQKRNGSWQIVWSHASGGN